jgi:hypothetical protein
MGIRSQGDRERRRLPTLTTAVSFVVMAPSERTSLYLRGVPRDVIGEAKAQAARRGTTLARFVTEAMVRSLAPGDVASEDGPLAADFAWYEAHRQALVRRYEGSYVAIVGGKVIDHDRDFAALAERVFARVGQRPVLMPKVAREAAVVRARSPRRGEG